MLSQLAIRYRDWLVHLMRNIISPNLLSSAIFYLPVIQYIGETMKLFIVILLLGHFCMLTYAGHHIIMTRGGKRISNIKQKQDVTPLSYKKVTKALWQWRKSIAEGDQVKKRPLVAMDYSVYASYVDRWLQDHDLELDTGIERIWYKKIKAVLLYMANIKRYLENTKMDRDVNTQKIAVKRKMFIKAYAQLNYLIDHPLKVDKRKLTKLAMIKKLRDKKR